MSFWSARLIMELPGTRAGDRISRETLESLLPLFPGRPVCAYWTDEGFGHPPADADGHRALDLDAIVGTVQDVTLRGDAVYGLVSIREPALDTYLLNAERRGRLVEGPGLSVNGRAVTLPPEYGDALPRSISPPQGAPAPALCTGLIPRPKSPQRSCARLW